LCNIYYLTAEQFGFPKDESLGLDAISAKCSVRIIRRYCMLTRRKSGHFKNVPCYSGHQWRLVGPSYGRVAAKITI
jgi:hypothetical protein